MGDYGQYDVPLAENCINLKVGQPNSKFLPLELIRNCANLQFALEDPNFLQYGSLKGYPKFRLALSEFLSSKYSTKVKSEELFITNGVTGGLSLLCSLLTESHDLIFIEEPSYFLAIRIMRDDYKLNLLSIPLEEDGLDINYLRTLLEKGLRPKFLYTIPTCHNPTGRTMSLKKRQGLLALAQQYHFLIIADEVYQLLSFPSVSPPASMFTLDTKGENVIALGSFSKILAPALRLGWIQASEKNLKILCESGQLDSSGGNNPVIQGIVHQAILTGNLSTYIEKAKTFLFERAMALMKTLEATLPSSCSFEKPLGGYFLLVKLPSHLNAAELLPYAEKHKVLFLPGSAFSNTMKNYLRLSFSWYTPNELEEGVKRLVEAIKEFLQASEMQQIKHKNNVSSGPTDNQLIVGIHGHTGRLGSLIAKEVSNHSSYKQGKIIQTLDGVEVPLDAQVIIDVTLPAGTKKLVSELLKQKRKTPLIIGTTGDLPLNEIKEYAKSAPVVIKSNFSAGVPLMCKLAQHAVQLLPKEEGWNCEIMEIHHTKKLDAPSGTAKTLKRVIELADLSTGEALKNIPCTSQRLGDEIGQHTIYFAGPGERIELKHQATKREVFAIGAVRTIGWILNQQNGLYID